MQPKEKTYSTIRKLKRISFFRLTGLGLPVVLVLGLMIFGLAAQAQAPVFYNNGVEITSTRDGYRIYINGSYLQDNDGNIWTIGDDNQSRLLLTDSLWNNSSNNLFTYREEHGVVLFVGNDTSFVGGSGGEILLNKLYIDKDSSSKMLYLLKDIGVNDTLRFQQGSIFLNGYDVVLDSSRNAYFCLNCYRGILAEEDENNRITGDSGEVIKTLLPGFGNFFSGENIGNTGAEIQNNAVQCITVNRGNRSYTTPAGESISRYYKLTTYPDPLTDAAFRFHYFDKDLGNTSEISMKFNRSDDGGGTWVNLGADTVYFLRNFAEKDSLTLNASGTSQLWTLVGCDHPPHIPQGQGGIVCGSDTFLLDAGTGNDHYKWSTGATTQTFNYIPATSVNSYFDTVTVWTDSAGCETMGAVFFEYHPEIILNFPDTMSKCEGTSLVLDATQEDTVVTPEYCWLPLSGSQYAQCPPPATGINGFHFVFPEAAAIIPGIPYDETVYFEYTHPIEVDAGVFYDWLEIDSITDLPPGITYTVADSSGNGTFELGETGCIHFSGTTNAPPGQYPLEISLCGQSAFGLFCATLSSYTFGYFPPSISLTVAVKDTESTIEVTSPGAYVVKVTYHGCPSAFDTVMVVDVVSPDIPPGQDTVLCGPGVLQLDAGPGKDSYLWSTGDTTQIITYTADSNTAFTDSVTVYMDIPGCSSYHIPIVVEYHPEVDLSQLPDTAYLCANSSLMLDVTQNDTATHYWWFTNDQGSTVTCPAPITGTPGLYPGWQQLNKIVPGKPYFQVLKLEMIHGNVGGVCPSGGFDYWEYIVDSIAGLPSGLTYSIQNATGDRDSYVSCITISGITNEPTGLYDLDIWIYYGATCASARTPNNYGLIESLWPQYYDATYNLEIAASGSAVNSVTSTGTYYVSVQNNGCPVVTDSAVVLYSPSPPPVIYFPPLNSYCPGDTLDAGVPNMTYLWSTGDTTQQIEIDSSGSYIVTVTNSEGCSSVDSVWAWLNEVKMYFSTRPVTCSGINDGVFVVDSILDNIGQNVFSVYLTDSTGFADTVTIYNLEPDHSDSIINLSAGTYFIQVLDGFFGCTYFDTIIITAPPGIQFTDTVTHTSCQGLQDGAIDISLTSNAIGPFTYLWNTGDTSEDLVNLAAGFYSLTITDSIGCNVSIDSIEVQNGIAGGSTALNGMDTVICFDSTFQLDVGLAAVSYQWSNGDTLQQTTVNTSGIYTVVVKDSQGCILTDSAHVYFHHPVVFYSVQDVTCNGDSSGSITIDSIVSDVPGSAYAIQYADDTSFTAMTRPNLAAGTYILITSETSYGCAFYYDTIPVAEPAALQSFASVTNVTCSGLSNGKIDLTLNGAQAPVTYLWSNSATTQDITALAAGTYIVTATDNNGCLVVDTAIITEPVGIILTVSATNVSCFGNEDGGIDITPAGGNPPYSYHWTTNDTTQDITNLAQGSYIVTVTDLNFCTLRDTIAITQPDEIMATLASLNSSCGNANGMAAVDTVVGGTSPYHYLWLFSQDTTATTSNLSAGTYSVVITDNAGCVDTSMVAVSDSSGPAIDSVVLQHVSVNGAQNGAIDIFVSGGIPPYSFSWNSGVTTEDLTNLGGGNYSVTVTDSAGCTAVGSYTINEPAALTITPTVVGESCIGTADGSVAVSVSGGRAPYQYSWSTGATNNMITGLASATYYITVTDSNLTAITDSFVVGAGASIYLQFNATDVTCNGGNNGAIDLSASGGTGTLSYSWSNGEISQDISGLAAAIYTVTVSDAVNCSVTGNDTVNEPLPLVLNWILPGGCAGDTLDTGIPGMTYAWSNGATTQQIPVFSSGTYKVTVTDQSGCSASDTAAVLIRQAKPHYSIEPVSCSGFVDAAISLDSITSHPQAPPTDFQFHITEATLAYDTIIDLNAGAASNLGAGTYYIEMSNANTGCSYFDTVVITDPLTIQASVNVTDLTCQGYQDGAIDLTLTAGGPVTYLWSTGSTAEDIASLTAGFYAVTITNSAGCNIAMDSIQVQDGPSTANVGQNVVVVCFDDTYTLDAGVVGATSYQWSSGETVQQIVVDTSGTYAVTVDNGFGCMSADTANVYFLRPDISYTVQDISCNGAGDGSITVNSIVSDIPAAIYQYKYADDTTFTSAVRSNLVAGTYVLFTNEVNFNCAYYYDTITIGEPPALQSATSVTNVSCSGRMDGAIDLTLTNGQSPVTYLWSNGATTQDISGLAAGSFVVTATDNGGCVMKDTAVVIAPLAIGVVVSASNVSCFGLADGNIDITTTGGNPPYTYRWTTNDTTEDISNLTAGSYSLTVTDINYCSYVQPPIAITQPSQIVTTVSSTNANCGVADGTASVDLVTGGTPPYSYLWLLPSQDTTTVRTNLTAGTYSVVITDMVGCADTSIVSVSNNNAVLIDSVALQNVTCSKDSNGAIDIFLSGGNPPYVFHWSNGSTTEDISNLSGGNYSLTLTDAASCSSVASYTIHEPTALSIAGIVNGETCNGSADGSLSVIVTGGTSPYSYNWSTGDSTAFLNGLTNGTYVVGVSDSNACIILGSYTIYAGSSIALQLNATDVSCLGNNDGAISTVASGGTGSLSYLWSNGEISSAVSGLQPGGYSVTVTDALGCFTVGRDTINEAVQITASTSVVDLSCYDISDGAIDITVSGGVPPYSYSWSNGGTGHNISALEYGSYTVTVTDHNNCALNTSASVGRPDSLEAAMIVGDEGCAGDNVGRISISPQGGIPPYSYLWNTGQTVKDIDNLDQGVYALTITDKHDCKLALVAKVDSLPPFDVKFLAATPVNAGDTIYFVDVSYPKPETWFWSFSDSLSTSSTEANPAFAYPKIYASDTSYYGVTLVASGGGCTDSITKMIKVVNSSGKNTPGLPIPGTEPLHFVQVKAYPNPTSGEITVDIELSEQAAVDLQLYNIEGRYFYASELTGNDKYEHRLNLNHLAAGVYFIRVRAGNDISELRIVLTY